MDEYILTGPITIQIFPDTCMRKYAFIVSPGHIEIFEKYMSQGTDYQKECACQLFDTLFANYSNITAIVIHSWAETYKNTFLRAIRFCIESCAIFKDMTDVTYGLMVSMPDGKFWCKKKYTEKEFNEFIGNNIGLQKVSKDSDSDTD